MNLTANWISRGLLLVELMRRLEGHLQIHKEVVDAGTTASDLAPRDQDQKLQFLPGFLAGKEEKFAGRLNGVTISYEFIKTGKPMMGRTYYLQVDNRTIYALRFNGLARQTSAHSQSDRCDCPQLST